MGDETYTEMTINFDLDFALNQAWVVQFFQNRWDSVQMNAFRGVSPGQASRLEYLFDMYQQYQLVSMTTELVPNYYNTVIDFGFGTQLPASQVYNRLCEVTILSDMDDVRGSVNFPDEYFMARAQPNAVTKPFTSGIKYTTGLNILDAMPQVSSTGVANVNSIVPGDTQLNYTAPQQFPWMPTKSVQNTSGSGTYIYNYNIGTLGHKIYVYCPYIFGSGTNVYGLARSSFTFRFRYPEYRLNVPKPSLIETTQTMMEENAIAQAIGVNKRPRLDPTPTLINPVSIAIEQHRIQMGLPNITSGDPRTPPFPPSQQQSVDHDSNESEPLS